MRRGILEAIEGVLEEKLTEALGTGRHERGQARRGERNGHRSRRITTAVGARVLDDPRGGIVEPEGRGNQRLAIALAFSIPPFTIAAIASSQILCVIFDPLILIRSGS
jgi:hypothetical protein